MIQDTRYMIQDTDTRYRYKIQIQDTGYKIHKIQDTGYKVNTRFIYRIQMQYKF